MLISPCGGGGGGFELGVDGEGRDSSWFLSGLSSVAAKECARLRICGRIVCGQKEEGGKSYACYSPISLVSQTSTQREERKGE